MSERTIERVSVATDGAEGDGRSSSASLSADGRFVLFESDATDLVSGDANDATDIFLRDLSTGAVVLVSVAEDGTQGDDRSANPAISGDGRFVAFESRAGNLVSDDGNSATDIFVRSAPFCSAV